ncbi:gamma-glutamyltransferase, partial [Microbacterium sp. ZXX196]|nr:gamma-glutamyltransferase [Microbacterium sp. ZXX196]
HLQVAMNLIDFSLNPQSALDAPRWQWVEKKVVQIEPSFPEHIAHALARKGHDVQWALDSGSFGRGQIIVRNKNGVLAGGTESRTDGCV